jgi:SAM-dependent methyltransferase
MSVLGQFDSAYSDYWRSATSEPAGAGGPPSPEKVLSTVAKLLPPGKSLARGLDVACGHGRLAGVMGQICQVFDGVEIESSACSLARAHAYQQVFEAPIETFTPSAQYDFILCWAAYEVLDQQKSLLRMNQLLAASGLAVLTGKNANYLTTDRAAREAEAGAAQKNFHQWFTDTSLLENSLGAFGFALEGVMAFAHRGDMAAGAGIGPLQTFPREPFYEFAICVKKTNDVSTLPEVNTWASRASKVLQDGREDR